MKTPTKVSIKAQRIAGTLSRMQSRMSITFKVNSQYILQAVHTDFADSMQ